jgi:protein-arginine kinase activator protein McsA
MCGFGIDTSVASAEEVENAILNQGKEEIHVCENCGSEITDGRKNDGSVWSAKDIAAYTARKFGKELCTECAKKESSK